MKGYLCATACTFALAISSASYAQTAPVASNPEGGATSVAAGSENGTGLDDIIVTARKREENLQKAPAAIVAVSGAALTNAGITGPLDLIKVLPNTSLREQNAVAQTFIRGVGSRLDFPNTSPAVAFTYNGIIIPRYGTSGILFDLGSVQQIAGPQGTLYGGSAAGGAINLLTARPGDGFAGDLVGAVGTRGTFQGALNQDFAITPDTVSLRAAVAYNRHDPFQSRGLDSSDKLQGRLSLLARPTGNLTALIFASASRTRGEPGSVATIYGRPVQSNPRFVPATGPAGQPITSNDVSQSYDTYVVGANIDLKLGNSTITYIPGYVKVRSFYEFYLARYNVLDLHDRESQVSQELRYNGDFGALKLSGGLFWLKNKTDFDYNIRLAVLPAAQGFFRTVPLNDTDQTNESYSGFAQAIYSLSDSIRVTAGGRVSVDKINATGFGGAGLFAFNRKQTRPDWKVGVDFDAARDFLIYGAVQTGYIPFGYNPDSGASAALLPEAELLSYTAGFKSRLFGGRLEVNNEFFYYDYKDFQAYRFDSVTGRSDVLNARKSRIYGTDLSIRWLVGESTSLNLGVVAQNAKHTKFRGATYNFSGNKMASAPDLVVTLGVQQKFSLDNGDNIVARASSVYNSGYWGDYTNTFGTFQRKYVKTDLSLTYEPSSKNWSVQAFVNNVENTTVFGTLTPSSVPGGRGTGKPEAPRIIGLRITAKWN